MLVLITYDVSTITKKGRRRLRRIAIACQDYGIRVQKSVFECIVDDVGWRQLKHRLLEEYDEKEDSLRFYLLCVDDQKRIEHHGCGKPIDLEEPLII